MADKEPNIENKNMAEEAKPTIENKVEEKKPLTENKDKENVKEDEKAEVEKTKPSIEDKIEKNDDKDKKAEEGKGKKDKNKDKEKIKKTDATVNGRSLSISTKHSIAICNFIRGKNIEKAIIELENAEKKKIAIPMRGEIPHRKGMMSGRYPVKALGEFIKLLKSLKANAIANELELEKVKITCKANTATRPYKRFGRKRFKRTHIEIKLVSIALLKKAKKIKNEI